MITTLEIGTVVVPAQSVLDFDQEYIDLSAQTIRRTAAGGAILRRLWGDKLRTVITGKGWIPSAFERIDTAATHTLKCAMPRSVDGTTTSITIPANRRTDAGHIPLGWAVVNEVLVPSLITGIVANVATLTAVAGATAYRVDYYPQITAIITDQTCKGQGDANFAWSVTAEEI